MAGGQQFESGSVGVLLLLAADQLSLVNFGAYLVCASWYRHKEVEMTSLGEVGGEINGPKISNGIM